MEESKSTIELNNQTPRNKIQIITNHQLPNFWILEFVICLVIVSCILEFQGCAYNFSGFTPRSTKSVAIPVFENETNRYGLEEALTKSVTDAFIQDNRLNVVDRKKAGTVLLGKITRYSREPFSYDDQKNVKDYKIEMGLNLVYLSNQKNVVLPDTAKARQNASLSDTSSLGSSKTDTLLTKQISDWYAYSADSTEESGIAQLGIKIAQDILKLILE